jgi:hypothetical protein
LCHGGLGGLCDACSPAAVASREAAAVRGGEAGAAVAGAWARRSGPAALLRRSRHAPRLPALEAWHCAGRAAGHRWSGCDRGGCCAEPGPSGFGFAGPWRFLCGSWGYGSADPRRGPGPSGYGFAGPWRFLCGNWGYGSAVPRREPGPRGYGYAGLWLSLRGSWGYGFAGPRRDRGGCGD